MSSPGQREMVFCHGCRDRWYRDQHGLRCPSCRSEFVEIIEANNNPYDFLDSDYDEEQWPTGRVGAAPEFDNFGNFGPFGHPGSPFSNFPPQPANRAGRGLRYAQHRGPNGGVIFTTFSYTSSNRGGPADTHAQIMNNFGGMVQDLLGNIAQNRNGDARSPPPLRPRDANGPQQPQQVVDPLSSFMPQFFPPQAGSRSPGSPGIHDDDLSPNPLLGLMRMMLGGSPMMNVAGYGDAAYSQDEFDRIMSQLLEQAQGGGGAPPASRQDMATIPKKKVTQEWLESQESTECTICMDEAKHGTEVSELWCQHWFHTECIEMWLDTHDSCPHCRKTLQQGREEAEAKQSKSSRRERRQSSRPHSHHNWHGSGDSGGSSGDADAGGGGGIRERISSLFRGRSQ